jgi:hypothetical protein
MDIKEKITLYTSRNRCWISLRHRFSAIADQRPDNKNSANILSLVLVYWRFAESG